MADITPGETTSHPTKVSAEELLAGHPNGAGQVIANKLSVIIIAKNEARNIRACLESVVWADEIIVVDSGSTDDTVAICKEFGAQVYVHDWPGFGAQKNRALGYASKDWVLSLDADECVTPESRQEIEKIMRETKFAGYAIPRLSSFCGRYMRHSGWYPDYVIRLFLRGKAGFSNDLVHERIVVEGEVGKLSHCLLHEPFHNLEQLLAKVNQYSTAGAEMLHKKGRDASLTQAVVHALWAFFRTYFIRAGFLDGREGFMLAVSAAEGTYYRYAKRVLMQGRARPSTINIVEPTLMTEAGHCYSFISALVSASKKDWPLRIWMNRYGEAIFDEAHVQIQRHFFRKIRRLQSYFLYRNLLASPEKIFISTAGYVDLLLLDWASCGVIPTDKVYLYFHWLNRGEEKLVGLKKIALKQPNLVILGPTPSAVKIFQEAGFADARVVPYPITPLDLSERAEQKEFKHLLYAGAARQDKGFAHVVDLVDYLHQQKSNIPVVIQVSSENHGKSDAATLSDIRRLKAIPYPHLKLQTETLSASEYARLFSGAISLQLYNSTDFLDRISGVTLDSLSAGSPVLTTSGTWIARAVQRFAAGMVTDHLSPSTVFAAAQGIISDYSHYHANSLIAGRTLQAENSADMLYKVLAGTSK